MKENGTEEKREESDAGADSAPRAAETDFGKHILVLVLILAVVLIAALVSHLTG